MGETIRVVCSSCDKGIKAPAKLAGRIVKCPGCQASLSIPSISAPPPPPPRSQPSLSVQPVVTVPRSHGISIKAVVGLTILAASLGVASASLFYSSRLAEVEATRQLTSKKLSAAQKEGEIAAHEREKLTENIKTAQTIIDETKQQAADLTQMVELNREASQDIVRELYRQMSKELMYVMNTDSRLARGRLGSRVERMSNDEANVVVLALARIGIGAGTDFDADVIEELVGPLRLVDEYRNGSIPKASEKWLRKNDPDGSVRGWSEELGLTDANGFSNDFGSKLRRIKRGL